MSQIPLFHFVAMLAWLNRSCTSYKAIILSVTIWDHKSSIITVPGLPTSIKAGCCNMFHACDFLQLSVELGFYKVPHPCENVCPCNNNPILICLLRLCVLDYLIWRMLLWRKAEILRISGSLRRHNTAEPQSVVKCNVIIFLCDEVLFFNE